MGKGSARRPGDEEAYRRNWEIIFSKCPECGKIKVECVCKEKKKSS